MGLCVSHLRLAAPPHFRGPAPRRPVFGQPGRLLCHDLRGGNRRSHPPAGGPLPGRGPHLPRRSAGCHAGELHRPVPRSRAGGGPRHRGSRGAGAGGGGGAHPPGRGPPARPARSDRQAQIRTGERLLLPLYHQGRPLPLHQRLRGLRQMRRSLCGKQYPPPGRPPCVGGPVHPLYGLHLRMSCRSH